MDLAHGAAAAILASLIAYALLGGADFGGGVWDLLASGPRKSAQRKLIAKAIGPVWEANHVWLIVAIVVLFTAFPPAFAAVSTALHIPLALMLVGVVLRGASFSFRSYGRTDAAEQARWGRVFGAASVVAPIFLGVVLGGVTAGRISVTDGVYAGGFFAAWLAPFPFAVGLFALALFSYLAAAYLAWEADGPELADDFRRRALVSGAVAMILSAAVYFLSYSGAPRFSRAFEGSPFTLPLQLAAAAALLSAFGALWFRRYAEARYLAAAQTVIFILGWAASIYPAIIPPDLLITNAAAPVATLRLVAVALAAGSLVLVPSLVFLFRVFKSEGLD
ncbi:MAG: cytochrome d ubiquinol oxidase subunit II [Deltaproteobacteria bacterium]|nr:cytochrome d ubiquinol oxidase subunit II [Deltaproteobacteria bacterium]